MPSQLELDFRQAAPYFGNLMEGEKLYKTTNYAKYHDAACPYHLEHAFMKINGEVYAIDEFIGKGSFGNVKLAYDANGYKWVLKIEEFDRQKGETFAEFQARINEENRKLSDLNMGGHFVIRDRHSEGIKVPTKIRYKFYSLIKYGGETLADYFNFTDMVFFLVYQHHPWPDTKEIK